MLIASCTVLAQHSEHAWDYGPEYGPSHWSELSPEFAQCQVGHRQSPIDIRSPQKADLPAIRFDSKPSSLRIINNGHTVMINYAAGSFIAVGDSKYELKQFHCHRPSEEKTNGETFAMSLHMVHADESGSPAVIAVVLQEGAENALIRVLWNNLPR